MTDPEARTIPYTHWMYFSGRDAAERCAAELGGLDFLCGIDPGGSAGPGDDDEQWLLRAARSVDINGMIERHGMVGAIVARHGGFYDGGESGWLDLRTGEAVRQEDER